MALIDDLIKDGWLKTSRIIEAFRIVKRVDFLPEDMKNLAELNEALSIGFGQTISQPLVVAFMIEQLQPEPGDKILDIGSGSGWTAALLAEIVGEKGPPALPAGQAGGRQGKVVALEVIPQLKEFGEINTAKYKLAQVQFILSDGSKGYEKEAPFDKILCSAAVPKEIPQAWKKQLKINGRIVAPVGSSILLLVKKSEKDLEKTEFPGFAFVPLVEK